MQMTRLPVTLILGLALSLGLFALPASTSAQTNSEIASCLIKYLPPDCKSAEKAGKWAKEQTHRLFYDTGLAPGVDGDVGNAFQHCAGAGALSAWVGFDRAVAITADHEFHVPNSYNLSEMDLRNNEIGARIGDDAVVAGYDDTWGYVMDTCKTLALNGSLYGPCGRGEYLTAEEPGSQDPGRILECPSPGNIG